jgi:hypothetical protein
MPDFTKVPSKIIILEVPEDKSDAIIEAMQKRSYTVHVMDREGRRKLVDCPGCRRKLAKESSFTINADFVEYLTAIVKKMAKFKTVIILPMDKLKTVSPLEHDRCVILSEKMQPRAEHLGLVRSFTDGSRQTYFATAQALAFLNGEKPAAPCTVVTLDGEVVEKSGEILLDNIKFVDTITGDNIKRNARDAVKNLPEHVMNFVINGQMSLI